MTTLLERPHAELAPSIQPALALDVAALHDLPTPPGPRPGCDHVEVSPLDRQKFERWAYQYIQATVEVVSGDRPLGQLARHTAPGLYADLERRARLVQLAAKQPTGMPRLRTVTARPAVQKVSLSFITHRAVEACATIRQGARTRAVAVRFEERRGKWHAAAVEFC